MSLLDTACRTDCGDFLDSIAISKTGSSVAKVDSDVPARFQTDRPCKVSVGHQFQHMFDGVIDFRVCPYLAFPERIGPVWDRAEFVTNEAGITFVHKVQVRRIRSCDGRLTKKHGRNQAQTETFRSVQRKKTITTTHQIFDFVIR